jgi:hypothetical protein
MITNVGRSVIFAVAVVTMSATFTSAGTATEKVPAKCAVDPPTVTAAADGTVAQASTNAQCTAGMVTLFKVSLTAEATGSQCTAPVATIEPNPDLIPTWIKVRVDLACHPSVQSDSKGKISAKIAVKMVGPNDITLASYGLGDGYLDPTAANMHGWHVGFVAGIGTLPALDPGSSSTADRTVHEPPPNGNDGSSQAQSDHEVHG